MKVTLSYFLAFFTLLLLADSVAIAEADATIVVPVRFHIVLDLPMKKDHLEMMSWVTKNDIENSILPEVNRIWRPAGISFVVESILNSRALSVANQAQLIDGIVNSHRDSRGKSDPKRIKKLNKLIDWTYHNSKIINVYLVPYLGEKSQGNAKPKRKRIFVGQWSDKASKGRKPPEKFQLTEPLPFKTGSISRTIAHEIGHVLGLKHPARATQSAFDLLMGGKRAGYSLTQKEIEFARKKAAKI